MQTTVNQLVALVQDAAACAEWADLCKQAQLLETTSDTEMYVYTLNDLPWPVTDREAVAHVAWAYQPDTETVTMRATVTDAMDAPDDMKKKKNTVRLTYGVTQWTFIPAADGKVEVISHAHVDPGGATPAWLTNRLLTDSPVKTLQRMRDIVTTDRYKGDEFAFMQAADSEPANTQTATPVE